ncbi:MAG: glycosyltransferase [Verrucomicrobia bacterium]|nr:glycosyltransferase [Verrucomicrobiota bacterium]
MPRILHVINSFDIGGNERFLVELLRRLDRAEFVQEVCVPDRGRDYTFDLKQICESLGVPIHVVEARGNLDRAVGRRLRALMAAGAYDIVHTHLVFSQYWGRRAASAAGIGRIISSEQNAYRFKVWPPFRWIEQRLTRSTECVVACSEHVRQHLVRRVGLPREKIALVYNGVDTEAFAPTEADDPVRAAVREEMNVGPGEKLIGTVGHLNRQKGHDVLIAALADVVRREPTARLAIAGRGPLRRRLEALAAQHGVAGKVIFAGLVGDVARFLKGLDVFAFPSRWEGFGIALIEAMATGLPVVASRTGGIKEIVEDWVSGLLVPIGDRVALSEALLSVVCDTDRAHRLAQEGLARVRRQFSLARTVEQMSDIYRGVQPRHEQSLP